MSGKVSKRIERPYKCEICGKKDSSVRYTTSAYHVELNDDYSKRFLCDECSNKLAEEI